MEIDRIGVAGLRSECGLICCWFGAPTTFEFGLRGDARHSALLKATGWNVISTGLRPEPRFRRPSHCSLWVQRSD